MAIHQQNFSYNQRDVANKRLRISFVAKSDESK